MAASQGIPTQGIVLAFASDTLTTFATSMAVTNIGHLLSFNGPSGRRTSIDISHLDPDGSYMEFIGGLIDMGEFSGELRYAPRDASHSFIGPGLLDDWTSGSGTAPVARRSNRFWRLKLSDDYAEAATVTSFYMYFRGHLNGWNPSMPFDDSPTVAYSIKLSGQPTLTSHA